MGLVVFPTGIFIEVDDVTLEHLRRAAAIVLRQHIAFTVSWKIPRRLGNGRQICWVSPSTPLSFRFDAAERPTVDSVLLNQLVRTIRERGAIELAIT